MKLLLQGVVWDCPSPSHLTLSRDHYDITGRQLDISFLGDSWLLAIEQAGNVKTQIYPSRDAAVAFVAQAFASAAS